MNLWLTKIASRQKPKVATNLEQIANLISNSIDVIIIPSIICKINKIFVNIFTLLVVQEIACVLNHRLNQTRRHQGRDTPAVKKIGDAHFVGISNPLELIII